VAEIHLIAREKYTCGLAVIFILHTAMLGQRGDILTLEEVLYEGSNASIAKLV